MAINEVVYNGQTLISLASDTVTPSDLTEGVTAHDAAGNLIVGTAVRGMPVGFEYLQTNPNIRAGSLPMVGGLWSREIYADLWAWVQEQPGYLISEEEWQALASANNGAVPFYSTGDGSTTFRVPALTVWVKGASNVEEVGDYLADTFASHKHNVSASTASAGEHTHTGSTASAGAHTHTAQSAGAHTHTVYRSGNGGGNWTGLAGSPSNTYAGDYVTSSNGAHTHTTDSRGAHTHTVTVENAGAHTHTVTVTESNVGDEETRPKTIVGVYCVVAYGSVVSSGEVSLDTVTALLGDTQQVLFDTESTIDTKLEETQTTIDQKLADTEAVCREVIFNADLYSIVSETTDRPEGSPTYGLE